MIFGRPLRSPAERYRRMAKVSAAQVQEVAKEILRPERLIATIVGSFTPALARKTEAIFRTFG
jgi:predicted Zn-dependent peptidase